MKIDRAKVHAKYDGHCGYCGKEITIKEMQVDHMNPKSMLSFNLKEVNGEMVDMTNDMSNLMPSCRRCNHYKRAETVKSFRVTMTTLHERIKKAYINKVAIDYGIIELKPFDGTFFFERANSNPPT